MFRSALAVIGRIVAAYPKLFLVLSTVVAALSFVGFYSLPRKVALSFDEGFSSPDSPSVRAVAEQMSFFGGGGKPWYMGLFAEPRFPNNTSMIGTAAFNEFRDFYKGIKSDLVISGDDNGNNTYLDYCGHMCDLNEPLFKTISIWQLTSFFLGTKLEWPVTSVMEYKSNIGKHFFVRKSDSRGEMTDAKLVAVYFMLFVNGTDMATALENFEHASKIAVDTHNRDSSKLTYLTLHAASGMEGEIKKGMTIATSFLLAGFLLVLFWCLLGIFAIVQVNSRLDGFVLLLFPLSLLLPLFTSISAFTVASCFSLTYNILFFLAPLVSIGASLDSVVHLYQAYLMESNEYIFDSTQQLLAQVFTKNLRSILSNIFSFVPLFVGALLPIEAFANLSILLASTLIFSFFYLIFFFAPLLVICYPARTHLPVNTDPDTTGKASAYKSLIGWMATFYTSSLLKMFALTAWCILGAMAMYGVRSNMKADFDYRHLLPPNSPAAKGASIMTDIVWPDMLQVIFFIENPPNFADPAEYKIFSEMINEMERMPYAVGRDANMMWIYDFERFTKMPAGAKSLNMSYFNDFINHDIYKAWNSGVQYTFKEDQTPVIERMIVMIAFNGTRSLAGKARLITQCREVASRFSQFQPIAFDTEVATVDVLLQIPAMTYLLPSVLFSMLFLWLLIFSTNVATAIVGTIMAASLYGQTLGLACLLNIPLNPFSVGILFFLSVLSPRHIVHLTLQYHACNLPKIDNTERMENALFKSALPTFFSSICGVELFLPAVLCGITVAHNLGLLCLLHLCFGLLHSFLFLPLLLSAVPRFLIGKNCFYTSS